MLLQAHAGFGFTLMPPARCSYSNSPSGLKHDMMLTVCEILVAPQAARVTGVKSVQAEILVVPDIFLEGFQAHVFMDTPWTVVCAR